MSRRSPQTGRPTKDRGWNVYLDRSRQNYIATRRSSAHPVTYAITLVTTWRGRECAVRTYDNSHTAYEHHEHRYIGSEKQPPTITTGGVNEAMHRATSGIEQDWCAYVAEWRQTIE